MGHLEENYQKYAALMETGNIQVKIVSAPRNPYEIGIASARTCYSSRGIITPQEITNDPKEKESAEKIARSTLKAGHLTTRQHSHFIFSISGVSRYLVWQNLHFHPYYNSEQVSQRYVEVKDNGDWYHLPEELNRPEIHSFMAESLERYRELIRLSIPVVEREYFRIHRVRAADPSKYQKEIQKKAMETARYVLPIATGTYLYHTISNLTLLRYYTMLNRFPLAEWKILVLKMIAEATKISPELVAELPEPLPPLQVASDTDTIHRAMEMNKAFDSSLAGKRSRMVDYPRAEFILNAHPGFDPKTLASLLDAVENPLLSDVVFPVSLDPEANLLNQFTFTFQRKISHSADSQAQRHRTLAGSRPFLKDTMTLEPDFITPALYLSHPPLRDFYGRWMEHHFGRISRLHRSGFSLDALVYLLPNAFPVRYYETGSALAFFHKWKTRTCLNAQEEIFASSLDDISEMEKIFPDAAAHIGPPCVIRHSQKPRCPEGSHFCGIPVWRTGFRDVSRIL